MVQEGDAVIDVDLGFPGTWYSVMVGTSVGVYKDWLVCYHIYRINIQI